MRHLVIRSGYGPFISAGLEAVALLGVFVGGMEGAGVEGGLYDGYSLLEDGVSW